MRVNLATVLATTMSCFWAALACVAPTSVGVKPSKPFAYPRTLFCQSQGHPQVLQCDSLFEFLLPRDGTLPSNVDSVDQQRHQRLRTP